MPNRTPDSAYQAMPFFCSALNSATAERNASRISGVSVVTSTFSKLSGDTRNKTATSAALASSYGLSRRKIPIPMSVVTNIEGRRNTTSELPKSSMNWSTQPTMGG